MENSDFLNWSSGCGNCNRAFPLCGGSYYSDLDIQKHRKASFYQRSVPYADGAAKSGLEDFCKRYAAAFK